MTLQQINTPWRPGYGVTENISVASGLNSPQLITRTMRAMYVFVCFFSNLGRNRLHIEDNYLQSANLNVSEGEDQDLTWVFIKRESKNLEKIS